MKQIIVMVAEGKGESTDFITIKLFDTRSEANKAVAEINKKNKDSKYWTTADIVAADKRIEIDYEFNPNVK